MNNISLKEAKEEMYNAIDRFERKILSIENSKLTEYYDEIDSAKKKIENCTDIPTMCNILDVFIKNFRALSEEL